MDAKGELVKLAKVMDKELEDWWGKEIRKKFGFNGRQKRLVKKLLSHAKEHNLRSAKRLRACFVYYSYLLGKKKPDKRIYRAAMAVELVHTALLMHDDFMDEDELRRGGPTSHIFLAEGDKHFGEAMAVDVGDAVLSLGYELLNKSGFEVGLVNEVVGHLLRTIVKTAWGQALDVSLEKEKAWTEEDVLTTQRAKTSIYTYENPLMVGAILAELRGEVKKILKEYARWGGIAFQLQDDILGLFGDPKKTGKSDNSDMLAGKRTLLVLKALDLGNKKEKQAIKRVWGKKKAKAEEIKAAKEAIIKSGSLLYSRKMAKEYAVKAVEVAKRLRKYNLTAKAVDFIEGMAVYMVEREV